MTVNDVLNGRLYGHIDAVKVIKLDKNTYTFTDRTYDLDVEEDRKDFKVIENKEAIAHECKLEATNKTSRFTDDPITDLFVTLTVVIDK